MADQAPTHVLYYNPFSVCSTMVRYSFALRGAPKDPQHEIRLREEMVDIMHFEQLTEHFLCEVNANGEVPVLVSLDSNTPMPESVDITYSLAQSYPALLPAEHQQEIQQRLAELHDINFFSLTFTGKPQGSKANKEFLAKQLEGNISDRYRRAIKHKVERINTRKVVGLEDEQVQEAIRRTKMFTSEIESLLGTSKTGWILGTEEPTALDAHVVVFLARLHDVRRDNLVPELVRKYRDAAMEQVAFRATMQGRSTVPPGFHS